MKKFTLGSTAVTLVVVALVAAMTTATLMAQGEEPLPQGTPSETPEPVGPEEALVTVSLLVGYQARLVDPSTGQVKPDGDYGVTFGLYDVDISGVALWTETKTVTVNNGVFSTYLGDTTTLNSSLFNGQALWLGIRVESDAEAMPRQPITVVPYAASLAPGAQIMGSNSPVVSVKSTNTNPLISAIYGEVSSTSPGSGSTGVRGVSLGTTGFGIGVWGSQAGDGWGVYGSVSDAGWGVYGYSPNGIGVRAASSSGTALYASGDAVVTGKLTVGSQSSSVPIAYAYINANGTKSVGTSNVSSNWNAATTRYEITIAGENYSYNQYITNVSLITNCSYANSVRTSSSGGMLLVYVYNSSGSRVQCDFQFTTYKP